MEERRMEVSIIKAEDLEDVNRLSRMKPFARVKISPIDLTYSTMVDEDGGVSPYWNDTFAFMMPEAYLWDGTAKVTVEIWTEATMGDKEIGAVTIPLTEVAAAGAAQAGRISPFKVTRIYTIRSKATGEPHGQVHVGIAYGSTGAVQYPAAPGDAGFTPAPILPPPGRPGSALPPESAARVPEPAGRHPPFYYPARPQPPPADQPPSFPPPSDQPPSYYPPPSPRRPPPLERRLPIIEPPFHDKPVIMPSERPLITPKPPPDIVQAITSPPGPAGTPATAISVTRPPHVIPPAYTTGLFSSPIGKMLLTDVTVKIRNQRPY